MDMASGVVAWGVRSGGKTLIISDKGASTLATKHNHKIDNTGDSNVCVATAMMSSICWYYWRGWVFVGTCWESNCSFSYEL